MKRYLMALVVLVAAACVAEACGPVRAIVSQVRENRQAVRGVRQVRLFGPRVVLVAPAAVPKSPAVLQAPGCTTGNCPLKK